MLRGMRIVFLHPDRSSVEETEWSIDRMAIEGCCIAVNEAVRQVALLPFLTRLLQTTALVQRMRMYLS